MDIIVNDFYGLDMATTKEYGFGGDALLLAEFAKPKFRDTVLDLRSWLHPETLPI